MVRGFDSINVWWDMLSCSVTSVRRETMSRHSIAASLASLALLVFRANNEGEYWLLLWEINEVVVDVDELDEANDAVEIASAAGEGPFSARVIRRSCWHFLWQTKRKKNFQKNFCLSKQKNLTVYHDRKFTRKKI